MNTTIENQLFRAFDRDVIPLCIMYLQHKYDLKYYLPSSTTNKSESSVYTEKLPKAIEEQLELFDESIMDGGLNSSLMDEIKMNLEECSSDANKRKRYLISLIKPFRELSNVLTSSESISRIEKERERRQNDYKDWLASVSSPKEKQEVKDACTNKMKELDDIVDRVTNIEDGFLNILNNIDYEPDSVEESFKYLVRLYHNYGVLLDALLLTFGVDLLSLQDECNIHILHRRNTTLIAYHLGSMEIAQRYIDELPERNLPKQTTIPKELQTEEATLIFEKASRLGFMTHNNGYYKWIDNNRKFAYFVVRFNIVVWNKPEHTPKNRGKYKSERMLWNPFEELFGIKNIAQEWTKIKFEGCEYPDIDEIFIV